MDDIYDSILAEDRINTTSPIDSILERDFNLHISHADANVNQQHTNEQNTTDYPNPLNVLSRVTAAIAKYPNDATLSCYADFQLWMYTHSNKHSPTDICQSLSRMFIVDTDRLDLLKLLNIQLIITEAYQTIGDVDQAFCQYDQAQLTVNKLNNTRALIRPFDITEIDRQQQKLKDLEMKIIFQSEFKSNFIKSRESPAINSTYDYLLAQLNMNNPTPEQCRHIWRQVVLQCVITPNVVIPSAKWLLYYARGLPPSSLQHANSLYVSLNLFLLGYGSNSFQENSNIHVFEMLDDIGRLFHENGSQSKQFSSVHKMAHVWGTAAVAYYLTRDTYKYLVCASMMRVSFELLGVRFLSSGIESLYLLAYKHAREFFTMMTHDPSVKLISPECINYFRRELNNQVSCIVFSNNIVDRYVVEVFNIDQSAFRA